MRGSSGRRHPPTYPGRRTTVVRYRKGWNTMKDATGDAAIKAHVRHCRRRGLSERTITARHDTLIRLREWASTPLLDVTREQVEDYLDTTNARATHKVYLSHIRAFFKWATDEDVVTKDPTRKVVGPQVKRGLPRPISEADLSRALTTAPPLTRAWMMVAAYAGLRAMEIGVMRGEHIVRGAEPYLMIPEGKGGKERTVGLAPVLLAELDRWPSSGWLWKPDGPYHWDVVSRHCCKHLRDQGISATLHALRHRFATQTYLVSGRDLRHTQEALGHASPATTAIYTALDPHDRFRVASLLPVVDGAEHPPAA
jgi:integrase/recombinase XerC